ncbi:MAG: response regulator [Deltaproteobacteria bacterium]|nr:response regulator [Deltaproteobacteria bacterium]
MEPKGQHPADASRSVLVVDDEEAILEVVGIALESSDYEVATASTVESAIGLLEEQRFGVLIVDKNLAEEQTGLHIVREAARLHPLCKTIVLTGYPSMASAIESVELGAFDYLTKPLQLDRLRERVDAARQAFLTDRDLSTAASRHDSLFEVIPGVVWVVDLEGRIKRINHRGALAIGYQPEELVGKLHSDLIVDNPRDPSEDWAFIERRTGERATRRKLTRLRTKGGETRLFEVHSLGTYDPENPGKQTGSIGVAHDVTELTEFHRKLRENNKTEALGQLVGEVVHDFRSLLTVILGNCDLMRVGQLPPGRDPISEIEKAAGRATTLLDRLLAFQRDEPVALVELSLARVVSNVKSMLGQLLPPAYELTVDSSLDDQRITGDWQQLEQVVLNLVINARDAMNKGGRVSIETRPATGQEEELGGEIPVGEYACLRVTDRGVGMSEEQLARATQRYYTTKKSGQGTGIGLAGVERIVKQHGGHLHIRSSPGQGTSVSALFPVAGSEDS